MSATGVTVVGINETGDPTIGADPTQTTGAAGAATVTIMTVIETAWTRGAEMTATTIAEDCQGGIAVHRATSIAAGIVVALVPAVRHSTVTRVAAHLLSEETIIAQLVPATAVATTTTTEVV